MTAYKCKVFVIRQVVAVSPCSQAQHATSESAVGISMTALEILWEIPQKRIPVIGYVIPSIVIEGYTTLPCQPCDKSAPLTVYILMPWK